MNVAHHIPALAPAAASGIAVLCSVAGFAAGQRAAVERVRAVHSAAQADDRDYVRVHLRAAAARATARAEALQLISACCLAAAACIALYAVVPGIVTETVATLAIAGSLYLSGDAALSCFAELRSITGDELFDDFRVRRSDLAPQERWSEFTAEHPAQARRLLRRRPSAPQEASGPNGPTAFEP